jgi:nicotinamide phosphoribosyltransferase
MKVNFIFKTDGYKPSHVEIFPDKTESLYNYMESRGGLYPKTVFFGNQAFMIDNLEGPRFDQNDINEADAFFKDYGVNFAVNRWQSLYDKYGGNLPIRIKAPPEGLVIDTSNVLTTCETTDPEFFWLPGYLEMQRLRGVWYPTTVATHSYYIKQLIYKYLVLTADDPDSEIGFKLHDFGGRGVSSGESAQIGGMAHLVNFMGSDTLEGIVAANHFYGVAQGLPGYSINALEHSTVIAWGEVNENSAYDRAIDKWAKKSSTFACVSDSYDFEKVVRTVWGGAQGQRVKDIGATVVIRPDSGDPKTVIVNALNILKNKGLTKVNSKGYHVLQPHLRIIQGDGLHGLKDFDDILVHMRANGFSASNIAFGMGGGLLQGVNRDTQKFADKPSEVTIDGVAHQICKNPKTDSDKVSKKGRLALIKDGSSFKTVAPETALERDLLQTVFENGKVTKRWTFDEVRANSKL